MKRNQLHIIVGYILLSLTGLFSLCHATTDKVALPFTITIEPQSVLIIDQQAILDIKLTRQKGYGVVFGGDCKISFSLLDRSNKSKVFYNENASTNFDNNPVYANTITIPELPNMEISELCVAIDCKDVHYELKRYFAKNNNGIVTITENPIPPRPEFHEIDKDTLSESQLNQECVIYLYFDSLSQVGDAKNLIYSSISDSSIIKTDRGKYRAEVTTTLGKVYKLVAEGFFIEYAIEPPWSRLYFEEHILKPYDEKYSKQPKKDSTDDSQSLKDVNISDKYFSDIEIDHVEGITQPGILPSGKPITFYIRARNSTGTRMKGISNGFRVYSDDGAFWNSTTIDTISLNWHELFDLNSSLRTYSADGLISDTVSYLGLALGGAGLQPEFDSILWRISIGPIDSASEGLHITLDSSFYGLHGYWQWSDSTGDYPYLPSWGGPYSFTICNTISISGYVKITEPIPPDTTVISLHGASIVMWDHNSSFYDRPLDSCIVDDSGYFSLGPILNSDLDGGDYDIYFKIYSINGAINVISSNGNTCYYQTSVNSNMLSGIYDTTLIIPVTASAPFFVSNTFYEARSVWYDLTSELINRMDVVLDNSGIGTKYIPSLDYLHVENSINESLLYPDTYDKALLVHEYTHKIQFVDSFFCSSPGGQHIWSTMADTSLAASEGFAHFFAGIVNESDSLYDYNSGFTTYTWKCLEDGTFGIDGLTILYANNFGAICEASVAGILWDIFDDDITTDDYSLFQWPPLPDTINYHTSDGIGDTLLHVDCNDIIDALTKRIIDGHYPQSIDEFWETWFQPPTKNHGKAMTDIWYEHGINRIGDANNDRTINMGDAIYVINYIFKQGSPPNPLALGDANCDHTVNIGDPIYLINYIFRSGPPPCP